MTAGGSCEMVMSWLGSTQCSWVVVHGLTVAATSHAAHQHALLFMLDYSSAGSLDFELLEFYCISYY